MQYIPYFLKDVYQASSKNLFNVISLFAGCGGSSTGYKLAGGNVLAINEFINNACEIYKLNYPNVKIFNEDIRNLTGDTLIKSVNLSIGELDILDGSPPCSSFSPAGSVDKLWGKIKKYSETKQRTDDLFFEFIRILNHIMPRVFITENTSGLYIGKSKKLFLEQILPRMESAGYKVYYKVINSATFGVPQSRRRLICVGVRLDLNKKFDFPVDGVNQVSVKEALLDVVNDEDEVSWLKEKASYYANSRKYLDLKKPGDKHPIRFTLKRNWLDRPSYTLLAEDSKLNTAGIMHPTECRRHTIKEVKRLMSFPDDFTLVGTFQQQYERLARSVPPLMYHKLIKSIYSQIFL